MSYLGDRIKLYTSAIKDIDEVLESRWNKVKREAGTLSEDVEKEANRRYHICLDCPLNSVLARTSSEYYSLYGHNFSTTLPAEQLRCSICLCPIEYRTLSMSSNCGLEHYNKEVNPSNPQPLKWTKYPVE